MVCSESVDVAVVGGGVIGLSVAWRVAGTGRRVQVIDPDPTAGASWVAGGMLAPVTEAWYGEADLLELGVGALAAWPDFAAELAESAGADPGLRTDGTMVVAVDNADRGELVGLADYLAVHHHDVQRLTSREARALEPALGPAVRGGLLVPGDLAVDNRALIAALRLGCTRRGVEFRATAAKSVTGGTVTLTDADPGTARTVTADVVVLAAGAWSGGLHPALRDVVRPVKGEILRLRARPSAVPPPRRTVRALVEGRHAYLVPRDGGDLVLGATQYEAGFDREVTVAGVRDLLRDAERVLPGIAEFALTECAAGLRPGTPDNVPVIGELEPGLLAATGHGRNGMLLAPFTAATVVDLVNGGIPVAATDPARFSRPRVHSGVSR